MATVKERIKALELELQELRGVEAWGTVGRDLRELFTSKIEEIDDTCFVIVMVESKEGVTIRDWKIPMRFARDPMAKAGSLIQQQLENFTREQGVKK